MKKPTIFFLTMILVFIQATNPIYAAETMDRPLVDSTLEEKYTLTRSENLRLRQEILRLRNQMCEKKAEKIPVLMYHHILPLQDIYNYNWSNNSSVISVKSFEEQMKYLYDRDFYTATLNELQAYLDGKITLPENTVVITFDDGYLSNAKYAYPIMKKYNFRGTIFMIGNGANKGQAPFDPSCLQSLSIYEAYKYSDVFDYGSHTYDLHKTNKNYKSALVYSDKQTIIDDLQKSRELLNTTYFAYPYGAYNNKTIKYLKETGYEMALTTKKGYATKESSKYELPRFSITPKNMPLAKFMQIVNGNYGL